MTEASRIVDELNRAIEGDPWHGDSVSTILRRVTREQAAARPGGGVHSIWEIVRHMTAWTGEVTRRLDGHPHGLPQEGDWPPLSSAAEADWAADVARLTEAHRVLIQRISTLSDEALEVPPADARDRAAGAGVSLSVMLHGLAQHHAYHAGQIAVLHRIVSAQ